jgi:hypothetical protein
MGDDVYEVNQSHHAFYEVAPYYVEVEKLPEGRPPARARIQAGYDIDVYGVKAGGEPQPSPDYDVVLGAIRDAVAEIPTSDRCTIEVIPFLSSVVLDSRSHLQAEGRIRIRITHGRGLEQPAGPAEADALRQVEELLQKLGIDSGGGRT